MALSPMRLARLNAGKTLLDIAHQTRVSMGRLSVVERGIEGPKPHEQERISAALGVAIETLWPAGQQSSAA